MSRAVVDTVTADTPARAGRLDSLWQAALSMPMHGAACGCGVALAPRIEAATLELDLLDYVEHKHALARTPAWSAALARRAAQPADSFPRWLRSLAEQGLPAGVHASILRDIEATLDGMATHAAGRLAPAASLAGGWLGRASGGTADDGPDTG